MSWLITLLLPLTLFASPVRRVAVHKDEVVTIKTALGIATIIQVPEEPSSVVLGDSNAFKVEYLNQAITIKPLTAHATSNLFIHTAFARFSVKLVPEKQADYIVYLAPYQPPKPKDSESRLGLRRKSDLGPVTLRKIARTRDTFKLELEFTVEKKGKIDPAAFWLLQDGRARPIQDLLLSSIEARKGEPLSAVVVIQTTDLDERLPLILEIRMNHTISFYLSKEVLWKN